jgi:sulfur-carrier protein
MTKARSDSRPTADTAMSVRVLFFGSTAERLGARERTVQVSPDGVGVEELKRILAAGDETVRAALGPPTRVAIDQVVVGEDARARPGQEVAFLPVFSGG